MDDKMEGLRAHLHRVFTPLDFSSIHGFPNGCYKRVLRIFLELFGNDEDSKIHHIASFCKLMEDLKVYHEDDLMIVFALTFERDAEDWFNDLWDESIDSMEKFLRSFSCIGMKERLKRLSSCPRSIMPSSLGHNSPKKRSMKNRLLRDIVEEIPDINIEYEKPP